MRKASWVFRAILIAIFALALQGASVAWTQETPLSRSVAGKAQPGRDLSKDKTLYVVPYAHLDTQWRWDYRKTIDEYLKNTLTRNFDYFEKFPNYVFNFTGSARYRMAKEYYPDLYEQLKKHIAGGRWMVAGSAVDEPDALVPSPESIIRHILYGNNFFRAEFGKESVDFMLPDCFGFPSSLPTIFAHCGLKGFSTQKLTWGSAIGIPFDIGVWEGPDGSEIVSVLNPGRYDIGPRSQLDTYKIFINRINDYGKKHGVFAFYRYFGVGDIGGALHPNHVAIIDKSVGNPGSEIDVVVGASDQLFRDITPEQIEKLPRYKGEILLTEHSAGTLTSQAYMKRWNRKNEQLADAAERAAVTAAWLGGAAYPRDKLTKAWELVLLSQMHDTLPGTCLPPAYELAWNDEILALNSFAAALKDSAGAVIRGLDTRAQGTAVVVYNALARARQDPVEATVMFPAGAPEKVQVYGPDNRETPSQILDRTKDSVTVLFLADVQPVSFSVFDVRAAGGASDVSTDLSVEERRLENAVYRVTLNDDGDVSSIVDKRHGNRELLASPVQLQFLRESPKEYPAWNMFWYDRQHPHIGIVEGPAEISIVENGPVRVSIQVKRKARNSVFIQEVRLSAGTAGERVEFKDTIDWQSTGVSLKAAFPFTVENPYATYNWGVGTIQRDNNHPKRFEAPSHEWFDLSAKNNEYGVSILEDCKFGSDKPDDRTLRLTLLFTPEIPLHEHPKMGQHEQYSQDWGRHDMLYALYGHAGDWREANTVWHARRINQPLAAFQAPPREGSLGRAFSFMQVGTPQVDARAVKQAEANDRIIVRLQELWGRKAEQVSVTFASPITSAYEVDGQERRIGDAVVRDGKLVLDMTPYSPRAFSVTLANAPQQLAAPVSQTVPLPFDTDVISSDANRADGDMDGEGRSIPSEMLPDSVISEGIIFAIGPREDGRNNALACKGQTIELPAGNFNRLYLLAAATEDTSGIFQVGKRAETVSVQPWTGFIGQYDNRVWNRPFHEKDFRCAGYSVVDIKTGYIKRDDVAWYCSHRHNRDGENESYCFSYLFKYGMDIPEGARELKLPDNDKIRIMAVTVARNENDAVRVAHPLYDDFSDRAEVKFRYDYGKRIEGLEPAGRVIMDRKERFEDLAMGAPAADDLADASRGNGIVVRYDDGDGKWSPHEKAGAVDGLLPRLNNGEIAQNGRDEKRCVWFDGEGRFFIDLKSVTPVSAVNTYSWYETNPRAWDKLSRSPQHYTLWGANGDTMPSVRFSTGKDSGWTLLGVVNTWPLGQDLKHGSSVTAKSGETLGHFRYLLWIAEDHGDGAYFTEIDVHGGK